MRLARFPAASLNYYLGNYEDVIWVVGDGRSGTTWLGDLINWDQRYRELFECIHPVHVKQTRKFGFNPYLRADDHNSPVGEFLHSVFSGKFKHLRADTSKPQLFYQGLLVKDIYGNLLIEWVHQNIPKVKKIMIIRNPFSVTLSKKRNLDWIWMRDATEFLEQNLLMHDHLAPFEHLISHAKDNFNFIENQILIWSIIHYVPFQQLNQGDLYIVFYENLFCNPEEELFRLFSYLYDGDFTELDQKLIKIICKPSRTQGSKFSTLSAQSPLDVWKDDLSTQQIDNGLKILEEFGLDTIYGCNSLPNEKRLSDCFTCRRTSVR
jgi:hypothetical protein